MIKAQETAGLSSWKVSEAGEDLIDTQVQLQHGPRATRRREVDIDAMRQRFASRIRSLGVDR